VIDAQLRAMSAEASLHLVSLTRVRMQTHEGAPGPSHRRRTSTWRFRSSASRSGGVACATCQRPPFGRSRRARASAPSHRRPSDRSMFVPRTCDRNESSTR
jgi:hypothetical protein